MEFKPTRLKTILSLSLSILFIVLIYFFGILDRCKFGGGCVKPNFFNLILPIIIIGLLIYIIWSFFEKN